MEYRIVNTAKNKSRLLEDQSIKGHSIDDARHREHGSEHGDGQAGEGADSHDVLAGRRVHMGKHLHER